MKNNAKLDFNKKIEPIIGIHPERLREYFKLNCPNLHDCSNCNNQVLIQEKGLTLENISIFLIFLRKFKANQKYYCIGSDKNGFILCYLWKLLPIITRIHREIFSNLDDVLFSLVKSKDNKIDYSSIYNKRKIQSEKYWNNLKEGVFSLISSYKRTTFKESKDILVVNSSFGDFVYLHGHQISQFLRGKREEQKVLKRNKDIFPFIINLGHYHKLGVFLFGNHKTIVNLLGSSLYPRHGAYFPEILSHVGTSTFEVYKKNFKLIINRASLKEVNIKKKIKDDEKRVLSFSDKMGLLDDHFRNLIALLPGNHDPFDEVYIRKNLSEKGCLPLIGMGDYIELSEEEIIKSEEYFLNFFKRNNFIPKSKLKKSIYFKF